MPSPSDVADAYRLWLHRLPEGDGVVAHHLRQPSREDLARAIAGSAEAEIVRTWPIGRAGAPALPVSEEQVARFMSRHLLSDRYGSRIAYEAATPIAGDDWAWSDDNAKIVQFLTRPGLEGSFGGDRRACLDFMLRMTDGPFVFRKAAKPRLETTGHRRWAQALWNIEGEADDLRVGPRFHDGRDCWALRLCGFELRVRSGRQAWRLPLDGRWEQRSASIEGRVLALSALARVALPGRFRSTALGVARLVHEVHADRGTLGTRFTLELDPQARPDEVELAVAQGDMSHGRGGVRYHAVRLAGPGRAPATAEAVRDRTGALAAAGHDFVLVAQHDTQHGFANAVHVLAATPTLHAVEWVARADSDAFDRCLTVHRFDAPRPGSTLIACEDRLLTTGGLYSDAAAYRRFLVTDLQAPPAPLLTDRSISYDYGVELDALAKAFALDRALCNEEAEASLSAVDHLLSAYTEHFVAPQRRGRDAVFSRQLSFAIMAAATLVRAEGAAHHRAVLEEMTDTLLAFGHPFVLPEGRPGRAFLMGAHSNRDAYADCHSAALLALAAAAPLIDDARLVPALVEGTACFALGSTDLDLGGGPCRIDGLHVHWQDDSGARRDSAAPWTYQAALSLRFLRRVALGTHPALQAVAAAHRDRLPVMLSVLTEQMRRSLHASVPDEVEFRSSAASGETNSETQPWAGLALFDHPFD